MFAMLVNSANMDKITETDIPGAVQTSCVIALSSTRKWYVVQGYVMRGGEYVGWTVLPAHVVESLFEYDPIKIQTDWDQIVRK